MLYAWIYFAAKNDSRLQLIKTNFNLRLLLNACVNGSSEMISNLSASVVNVLYNFQFIRLAGGNGVAAYGIIMYVNVIFIALHSGYAVGHAPIVSYNYGAGNHRELKSLLKKSLWIIGCTGVMQFLFAQIMAVPLVKIFAGYDAELSAMTVHGFRYYALAFLVMGFNVWGSSFFTALNNGPVSAAISFSRTLLFQVIAILTLPYLFGIDGIWISYIAAELMSAAVTGAFLLKLRRAERRKTC